MAVKMTRFSGSAPVSAPSSMKQRVPSTQELMNIGGDVKDTVRAGVQFMDAYGTYAKKKKELVDTKTVLDKTKSFEDSLRAKKNELMSLQGEQAMDVGEQAILFADAASQAAISGIEDERVRLSIMSQIRGSRSSFLNATKEHGRTQSRAAMNITRKALVDGRIQDFITLPEQDEGEWQINMLTSGIAAGQEMGLSQEAIMGMNAGDMSVAYSQKALHIAANNPDNPQAAMDFYRKNEQNILPAERDSLLNSLNGKIAEVERKQQMDIESDVSRVDAQVADSLAMLTETGNQAPVSTLVSNLGVLADRMEKYDPSRANELRDAQSQLVAKRNITANAYRIRQEIKDLPLSKQSEYLEDNFKLASHIGGVYYSRMKAGLEAELSGRIKMSEKAGKEKASEDAQRVRDLTGEPLDDALALAAQTGDFSRVDSLAEELKTFTSVEEIEDIHSKVVGAINIAKQTSDIVRSDATLAEKQAQIQNMVGGIADVDPSLVTETLSGAQKAQMQVAREVTALKKDPAQYVLSRGLIPENMEEGEQKYGAIVAAAQKAATGLSIQKISGLSSEQADYLSDKFKSYENSKDKIDFVLGVKMQYGKYGDAVIGEIGIPFSSQVAANIFEDNPRYGKDLANVLMTASTMKNADIPKVAGLTDSDIYSNIDSSAFYKMQAEISNMMPTNADNVDATKELRDTLYKATKITGSSDFLGGFDGIISMVNDDTHKIMIDPRILPSKDSVVEALDIKKQNMLPQITDVAFGESPADVSAIQFFKMDYTNNAVWINDSNGDFILFDKSTQGFYESSRMTQSEVLNFIQSEDIVGVRASQQMQTGTYMP